MHITERVSFRDATVGQLPQIFRQFASAEFSAPVVFCIGLAVE
jgi:hypothetical protein